MWLSAWLPQKLVWLPIHLFILMPWMLDGSVPCIVWLRHLLKEPLFESYFLFVAHWTNLTTSHRCSDTTRVKEDGTIVTLTCIFCPRYSLDEGFTWNSYQFSANSIVVYGLLTEPGSISGNFSLWGSLPGRHSWVVIQIDMTGIFGESIVNRWILDPLLGRHGGRFSNYRMFLPQLSQNQHTDESKRPPPLLTILCRHRLWFRNNCLVISYLSSPGDDNYRLYSAFGMFFPSCWAALTILSHFGHFQLMRSRARLGIEQSGNFTVL